MFHGNIKSGIIEIRKVRPKCRNIHNYTFYESIVDILFNLLLWNNCTTTCNNFQKIIRLVAPRIEKEVFLANKYNVYRLYPCLDIAKVDNVQRNFFLYVSVFNFIVNNPMNGRLRFNFRANISVGRAFNNYLKKYTRTKHCLVLFIRCALTTMRNWEQQVDVYMAVAAHFHAY